jgi:hypothetical protein
LADGTHPRDFVDKVQVGDPATNAWVEYKALCDADFVAVWLDPEDANQDAVRMKHRSTADTYYELLYPISTPGVPHYWKRVEKPAEKSHFKGTPDLPYRVRKGDTIGFFQGSVNGHTPRVVVKYSVDWTLGAEHGDEISPVRGPAPFPTFRI